MTKREFLDIVFALAPNEANAIMDAFDEYVNSNEPHWIPVTERLPVEYDNPIEFLCTLEDNDGNRYVDLIVWTGSDWENNYTDDNKHRDYGIDKVVGWMFSPMPMRKENA